MTSFIADSIRLPPDAKPSKKVTVTVEEVLFPQLRPGDLFGVISKIETNDIANDINNGEIASCYKLYIRGNRTMSESNKHTKVYRFIIT